MSTLPPTTPNANPIEALRAEILGRLNASKFFQAVPILHDERGDIDSQIQQSLKKNLNLVCVMELGRGTMRFPAAGAVAAETRVVFTITERTLFNRDKNRPGYNGKIASDVLCELCAQLNPNNPGGSPVVLEYWEPLSNMKGQIILQVSGYAQLGWQETQ